VPSTSKSPDSSLSPTAVPTEFHGLWRSVGYNRLLEIDAEGYRLYTVTAHAARRFEDGTADDFARAFDRLQLRPGGRLRLFHAHDVTRYEFERCAEWPRGCKLYEAPQPDPVVNFEAFCELFAENYAFFVLRGVDWESACRSARRQLQAAPTEERLLDVCHALIGPLADIHVHITTPDRRLHSPVVTRGPRQALQAAFELPTPQLSRRTTVEHIAARMLETLLADFAGALKGFRQAGNEVISWGTLRPGVGYLNLLRMFGFAQSTRQADDLPHRLHDAGPFMATDMASLDEILEEAMRELSGQRTLIVDARLNAGGFDRAGLLLCERLIEAPQTAFQKKAYTSAGFTAPQRIGLTPSQGTRFAGPVLLLTSAFTQSAGEVLALAMSALPNVRILGEPTQGILSDNLFHRLPNDWEVSLSNEVYESFDGQCFEAVGVPPHDLLRPLGSSDLIADLRAGLVSAVARAEP